MNRMPWILIRSPLLVVLTFHLSAPTASAQSAQEIFASAHKMFFDETKPREAINLYKASLDAGLTGEARERALLELADAHWAGADPENARFVLGKLLQLARSPEIVPGALWRLGMSYMDKGHRSGNDMGAYNQGQAFYARLAREYPQHPYAPGALMVQANFATLIEANRTKAIRLYEELAAKYPDSDETKSAMEWLPGLRKMNDAELQTQAREARAQMMETTPKSQNGVIKKEP